MAREKNKNWKGKNNKNGKNGGGDEKLKSSLFTSWTKRWMKAILMFLLTLITVLSFPFFDKAGSAGRFFISASDFLVGKALYTIPLFLFIAGLIFLKSKKKGRSLAMVLAIVISLVGVAGILAAKDLTQISGGWTGYLLAKLLVGLFGLLVTNIIFGAILLVGLFIYLQFIWSEIPREKKQEKEQSYVLNRGQTDDVKIKRVMPEKQENPAPASSKISLFK
ncbi:MAG: DNA translocase FtsK 4TM domain-containing protein, partial [Patescibacteria group bacterium]